MLASSVDLSGSNFKSACAELARLVSSDFEPDLFIGIPKGGQFTLEAMLEQLQPDYSHTVLMISLSRPGTRLKEQLNLKRLVLRFLPLKVLNVLRQVEALFLYARDSVKPTYREVRFSDEQAKTIQAARRILIVDDAIDSGATIEAVVSRIKEVHSEVDVRVAVITKTRRRPRISPEFYLYERTLIRFPWSLDAKH